MQVPVTLFDLVGAALHQNQTVTQIYNDNYVLGVLPRDGLDWIKSVALKLKKPCPFLEGQMCRIYQVRPIPCMLFPEYQAATGTLRAIADQFESRGYSCLHSPFSISKDRARVLRVLGGMLQEEVFVSDLHLFGRSPLWVDLSGPVEELSKSARTGMAQATEDNSRTVNVVTQQECDRMFKETYASLEPLCSLENRIRDLDLHQYGKSIFELLSDKKKIRRHLALDRDRPLVWTYVNGAIEERRQSLTPRELMFL